MTSGPVDDRWNAGITWLEEPLRGAASGPLAGRTLLVKDLIDTAGIRTTYGSRVYANHVPDRHAVVVRRALDAGATVLGKANLAEFAWSVLGSNEFYGTVHNPVRPGRTTGGSSSGNAAAVAAGLCDLGIGTDTGCSVRLPAAACDIVGLKPRLGTIPMDGVYPLCPSFDTVGPLARTVAEAASLWSVLSGRPVPDPRLDGLVVGLLRRAPVLGDGRETETSDAADAWVARLEALGARVVEREVPGPPADTWPVFQHEAARAHAATFPSRADDRVEVEWIVTCIDRAMDALAAARILLGAPVETQPWADETYRAFRSHYPYTALRLRPAELSALRRALSDRQAAGVAG